MAPPFNRFFIDIQDVPNDWEFTAWGALVEAMYTSKPSPSPVMTAGPGGSYV